MPTQEVLLKEAVTESVFGIGSNIWRRWYVYEIQEIYDKGKITLGGVTND